MSYKTFRFIVILFKFYNLYTVRSTLFINSVTTNVDLSRLINVSSNNDVFGSALFLYREKELVAHVVKDPSDKSYTLSNLRTNEIYDGFVKLLTYSKNNSNSPLFNSTRKLKRPLDQLYHSFQLYTSFAVPDERVDITLQTRRLLDEQLEEEMRCLLRVNSWEITIYFDNVHRSNLHDKYALKVSKYPNVEENTNIIQLPSPLKGITLSNLTSHELLRLSLCKFSSSFNFKENRNANISYTVMDNMNVFTGGIYKKGTLSAASKSNSSINEKSADNNTTLSDYYYKQSEYTRDTIRCYDDDEEYTGYPCDLSDVCIPLEWVCDGESDCKEGDDEDQCGDSENYYNGNYGGRRCRKFEFRCKSRGKFICLPNSWLCDGRRDCYDGWDEEDENCYTWYNKVRPGYKYKPNYYGTHCDRNEFRCWRGEDCVPPKYVCDGRSDCSDGSDELVCDNWSHQCDLNTEFRCYNTKKGREGGRRCIPNSWVCDKEEDCPNGEDESIAGCVGGNRLFSLSSILGPFGVNIGFRND